MCRSTNLSTNIARPEIWFRILHVASDRHNGVPVAKFHEQTVEIALGPKGAFENANVRALTRRVAIERVVTAARARRGTPRPPREARTPRVVELLRKAIEWRTLLESGEVPSQAEIARREGITRARVTQVLGLLRLTPEIQESILSLPAGSRRPAITERALRPIAQLQDRTDQQAQFRELSGWAVRERSIQSSLCAPRSPGNTARPRNVPRRGLCQANTITVQADIPPPSSAQHGLFQSVSTTSFQCLRGTLVDGTGVARQYAPGK
jgi:hypothetical protein